MFESIAYEVIMQRMIEKVLESDSSIDTREGSIVYNALAPAAVELQNMYIQLDTVLNETFADTASRDYLIKRCAERGVVPEAATKAILKGVFNIDVPLGSRFSYETLNYVVTEKIDIGVFKLECETAGIQGNQHLGVIIPIEYIDGLTNAQLTEVLIPGEDEEETEALRARYFSSIASQAFGGNKADYIDKVNDLDGVGGVKVYPTPGGVGGTVGLTIIDSTYGVPSSLLIDTVQTAVDPTSNSGEGVGIAPIGHIVTVAGVSATTVNITTEVTYQNGWAWADIEANVQAAIDAYFKELAGTWANLDNIIVRISQIETRLLDIAGVIDIQNTTINGGTGNLILGTDEIPQRGTVSDIG